MSRPAAFTVKTRRVKGKIVVTIPDEIVEANNIHEGETVEITVRNLRVDGFGVFRGIAPITEDDEMKPQSEKSGGGP